MKKQYRWKKLSEDGLLKNVNIRFGYTLPGGDSEEEAIENLVDAIKSWEIDGGDAEYVLLTVYTQLYEDS